MYGMQCPCMHAHACMSLYMGSAKKKERGVLRGYVTVLEMFIFHFWCVIIHFPHQKVRVVACLLLSCTFTGMWLRQPSKQLYWKMLFRFLFWTSAIPAPGKQTASYLLFPCCCEHMVAYQRSQQRDFNLAFVPALIMLQYFPIFLCGFKISVQPTQTQITIHVFLTC
jgi:hypothetical protein